MADSFNNVAWNQVNKAVGKAVKKGVDVGRKVAEAAVVNAIPTGKAASEVGKFVSRTTAGKMVAGEAKTVVRKFTQGKGANIVEQAPKAYKEGPKSPVKGTKVGNATYNGKNWVSDNGDVYTVEAGKKFTEAYNRNIESQKKNEETRDRKSTRLNSSH